jgi:Lon protease-like protein
MTSSTTTLPLFPLQTVLFPGGQLSLQIFEVRYLHMVRACHQADTPFGVVCLASGSEIQKAGNATEQLHTVGTLAHIEHLETVQAGLLRIQCTGTQRFRISQAHQQANGLWVAEVELLPNDQSTPLPEDLQACAESLAEFIEPPRGDLDLTLADCGWVANRWCELLPLAPHIKQQLMALDNPLLRLELVNDMLSASN